MKKILMVLTSCRACSLSTKRASSLCARSIAAFAAILTFCGCKQEVPLTFQAGTYEVTAQGHNGDIRLSVTFSDSCITDIKVREQHETPHIGDIVFDELIPQIIKANGTGVDAMTGATVTSRALMKGVAEAANMAKVSDCEQFSAPRPIVFHP